jgi:hypothetical protein
VLCSALSQRTMYQSPPDALIYSSFAQCANVGSGECLATCSGADFASHASNLLSLFATPHCPDKSIRWAPPAHLGFGNWKSHCFRAAVRGLHGPAGSLVKRSVSSLVFVSILESKGTIHFCEGPPFRGNKFLVCPAFYVSKSMADY